MPLLRLIVACVLIITGLLNVNPAPAEATQSYVRGASISGSPTVGTTLKVVSNFRNNASRGNYLLETAVFDSAGQRVAIWVEDPLLNRGQYITRTYKWNTAGLIASKYSVKQSFLSINRSR